MYKYNPSRFYTVIFFITWTSWFLSAYLSHQKNQQLLYTILLLPGLLAPFGIALWLSSKDPQIRRDFFSKLSSIKLINLSTIPMMLMIIPLTIAISIFISLFFGLSLDQFQISEHFSFSSGVMPVFFVLFLAATFEELGWRGYAIESLEERYTYFTATMIFGILWSFWHFPLMFIKDYYPYLLYQENIWYAINFMVSIIPIAFIISWIYHLNNESILIAIFFHFVINISQEVFQLDPLTKCIQTGVLTIFVALLVITKQNEYFTKRSNHS